MAGVLLLDQYAGFGGGQRILLDVARAFKHEGRAVRVLLPGHGRVQEALAAENFPVFPLPLTDMRAGRKPFWQKAAYLQHTRRATKTVVAAILEERPEIIYANAPRCFLPAVLAARRTGVPVVCALHLIFTGGLERRLISWCFGQPQVKRVIFCSDATAAPFAKACGTKGTKLHYWVSPEFLERPSQRQGSRKGLGLNPADVAVGVLGRISKTKGQKRFIEALGPLLESHPELRLFVAGAADFECPGEEKAVLQVAGGSPDPRRVTITGRMVEALPFLDAMDLLVVPSQWEEPFGLVAVEGMARGLPVVATRSGGLVEIVEDGVTGFHAGKDVPSLRRAVEPLVADAILRVRMGKAGRERVEKEFHPARQLHLLMESALG